MQFSQNKVQQCSSSLWNERKKQYALGQGVSLIEYSVTCEQRLRRKAAGEIINKSKMKKKRRKKTVSLLCAGLVSIIMNAF